MTKYQEAFHFFRKLPYRIPLKFANSEFCEQYDKHLCSIKELVDKATPKKARYENAPKPSIAYMYSCPNCGRILGVDCKPTYINYCDECGIKLDWSDKDGN